MINGYSFDPSSALIAYFALPTWVQIALPVMAAVIVLMNSVVGTALYSRRKALSKAKDLAIELADVKAKLSSETRWRLADERCRAEVPQTTTETPGGHTVAVPAI